MAINEAKPPIPARASVVGSGTGVGATPLAKMDPEKVPVGLGADDEKLMVAVEGLSALDVSVSTPEPETCTSPLTTVSLIEVKVKL